MNLFNETNRILRIGSSFFILLTTLNQIIERYINQYFPSLISIETDRHIFENEITRMLNIAGFRKVDKVELPFDECTIDRNYLNRLKSGIFSSLLLLDNKERENGLRLLENDIVKFENESMFPKYNRRRTALVAQKSNFI